MTHIKVVADPEEAGVLVEQLSDWLFPDGNEMIPLSRAFTILQALSVSMGAIIAACAFGTMEDERGRTGVVLDKKALIGDILALAQVTIRSQAEETLQ